MTNLPIPEDNTLNTADLNNIYNKFKSRKKLNLNILDPNLDVLSQRFKIFFHQQQNFYICIILDKESQLFDYIADNSLICGVTKRNPRDKENLKIAQTIAFWRALESFYGV